MKIEFFNNQRQKKEEKCSKALQTQCNAAASPHQKTHRTSKEGASGNNRLERKRYTLKKRERKMRKMQFSHFG